METGKRMSAAEFSLNETQQRAGWYVDRATEGRNQDKRGAALLRCSPTMFWRLRRGEGWTVERLSLAARVFGHSFVDVVFSPITGQAGGPGHALAAEIAELEAVVDRLATAWRRGPLDAGGRSLVDRGSADPYRVAPVEAGPIRREGGDRAQRGGGDSQRPAAVGSPISVTRRAAE